MSKILILSIILLISFLMTACNNQERTDALSQDQATQESQSRQNLDQNKIIFKYPLQKTIKIPINSPPIETAFGFIRFVGIIVNGTAHAALEISGKTILVSKGDPLDAYKIIDINEKEVSLCIKN